MLVETMQVATRIPVELKNTIDRFTAGKLMTRSDYFRRAIIKQAKEDGILKVRFDQAGAVYELDLSEVAA